MKLTKQVADEHTQGRDVVLVDDEITGFALRIRNGKRSWVFQYSITVDGKRVSARMKLGDYPGMTADAARKQAATLRSKVNLGGHPAAEKATARTQAVQTFDALVDAYLEYQQAAVRPATLVELTRYLKVHAHSLHQKPVTMITTATIQKLLDDVRKNTGKVSANRLRSTLSAAFAWGIPREYAASNPVTHTEKEKENSRERKLDDAELKAIWSALGDDAFGQVVKLLILTGQRLSEIAELKWSEIDFNRGVIQLPASRTKNRRNHTFPMSEPVRQILVSRQRDFPGVFESDRGQLGDWEGRRERLNDIIAERGSRLAEWTYHDLRRTFVSGLARLGIRSEVAEAVVNHVSGDRGGVRGIYQRYDYDSEKGAALDAWAKHIEDLTSGERGNVVSLRSA